MSFAPGKDGESTASPKRFEVYQNPRRWGSEKMLPMWKRCQFQYCQLSIGLRLAGTLALPMRLAGTLDLPHGAMTRGENSVDTDFEDPRRGIAPRLRHRHAQGRETAILEAMDAVTESVLRF